MSRKFWIFIALLLALMLALKYQMPRSFVWKPTFAHTDRQPFGCYVFDSVLAATMPHGYTVCRKTLSQLALQPDAQPRSIVVLCGGNRRLTLDVDTLFSLAKCGNRILLAAEAFDHELQDTLHIYASYLSRFSLQDIQTLHPDYDTITWKSDSSLYPAATYRVYHQLVSAYILANDTLQPQDTLAVIRHPWENYKGKREICLAASYRVGRGEIILVTTPLLLTNYGMLDCPAYVHRLMNRLKGLPVVRTEAYMPNVNEAETTPFREMLKRPPLRWALYLLLLGIVLLMAFTARRHQRPIPEEQPPRNYQLDFIRHIGTLKYMRKRKG